MLDIILQILSILGIILLVLLVLLVAVILLVLFFPVTYRIRGSKDEDGLRLSAKAKWLFGLLRVKYSYPEPNGVVVKGLWITLFDSGSQKKKPAEDAAKKEKPPKKKNAGKKPVKEKTENAAAVNDSGPEGSVIVEDAGAEHGPEFTEDSQAEGNQGIFGKIFQKFAKIKYTIRSIYDKIKKIWENISYYLELLQEEETKQLFSHVMQRLIKILKNIRPRHIKADILFGTGSPDTTGYVYGVYCMLAAALGIGFWVTPDFEQAVFKGEFDVSGHVTINVLLVNGLKLFLDKKLKRFISRMKAGKIKNENKAA